MIQENHWKPFRLCVFAVCRPPGQDGGLREHGDGGVSLQPGWQLPLLGAESPSAGGAPLHRDDRRRQPACRPVTGKDLRSEPWGFFRPGWGLPVLPVVDLPAPLLAGHPWGSECVVVRVAWRTTQVENLLGSGSSPLSSYVAL